MVRGGRNGGCVVRGGRNGGCVVRGGCLSGREDSCG